MVEITKMTNKIRKIIPKSISSNGWRRSSKEILLKHEMLNFTKAFKNNFVTLMISSLGLLVALTWNEFWKSWVSSLAIENTVPYKFYIALGTTILAVIFTYFLSKLKDKQ